MQSDLNNLSDLNDEVNEPSFVREDRNGMLHFDDAADAAYRHEKAMRRTGGVSPEIIPFDATDDYGFATAAEMGLSDVEMANAPSFKRTLVPEINCSLVIHAPDGPVDGQTDGSDGPAAVISSGYSVYAVELKPSPDGTHDSNDDIADRTLQAMWISGPGLRAGAAGIIAEATSLHAERIPFDANFVIVNDGTGKTVAKYPMFRIAA